MNVARRAREEDGPAPGNLARNAARTVRRWRRSHRTESPTARLRPWPQSIVCPRSLVLAWAFTMALGWSIAASAAERPEAKTGEPITVRSQSGQFVVHGLPMGPPASGSITSAVQYLRLDPGLTAVSLERIRQAMQGLLGWPNQWQGLITVVTEPVRSPDARVQTTTVRFGDGWGYRIVYPEIVDKEQFINTAVRMILAEFANRRAQGREAELPPWLVDGLSAELMATALPVLALEPAAEANERSRNPDPLEAVRLALREREPLSFDDLAMPGPEWFTPGASPHYRACAHLFVHELLRLRDGRGCLRRMLERLPDNLNWQTTFLQAFSPHFSRLLEVDQWYALAATGVRGRDRSSSFPTSVALHQLDEILATAADVRVAAQELPVRTDIRLQRVVTEWDFPRQHAVLIDKVTRLRSLQSRAAPELAGLVGDYARALVEYVGEKNLALPSTERARERLKPKGTVPTLIARLDELDRRKAALATGEGAGR